MSGAGAGASRQVDLAQVSVPRLFFALLHQRFNGTVSVAQPPPHMGSRTIWFRGGMPVFTDWVAPSEVLGQVLVTQRMIDETQLLRALEAMAAQGGLLGQHLLAQGVLDPPRLYEGLRVQCTRKLTELFMLRAGQGMVTVGEPQVEPGLLPVNVLGLILAGVGACYDETRVSGEMGPALTASVQATNALGRYRSHFRFRPGDEPALQALAAGTSLAQLTTLPGCSQRRGAQLIYTLWACQMLRTAVPAGANPSGPQPVASPTPVAAPPAPAPPAPAPPAPPAPAPPAPAPAAASPSMPPTPASPRPSPPAPPSAPLRPSGSGPVASASATPGKPSRKRKQTLDDASTPDDPDDPYVAELRGLEKKIEEGVHAFALFGVPLDAKKKDIRRAWGDLSRKFHPDALKSQGREGLHDRVSNVFAALSEAQQLLNNAEERAKLREAIESGEHEANKGGKDATATARAVFQSELLAKEADKLLRANRFDRALARYREASTYNPDEPDLNAAIAWCEYQVSAKEASDAGQANARLRAIIEEAPNIPRAHYFLGFVLVDQGNPAVAIETFRKAARLDQRLIDAERQARALEVRLGRTPKSSASAPKAKRSGLKGLFGKK